MAESIVESSAEAVLNVAKTERIRVLHVDDDQICLKVAKRCLETQGEFEVDTASSVNEALEKLKKTDYDVIVSDYQMPGKDGLEFLKELRKKGNTVPLIIFTGKGREEIAMKALNLGASGYFTRQGQPETVYGELAHGVRQATERKKTETKIWEREEKLRAVFSSSPDAIAVSDLRGDILDCNEAAWKMLGFSSREELIGKSSLDFIAQKDRQRAYETLKKTLEQGTTRNLEYTLLNKDGEESWGELSASIMKDSSGNPSGLVSIMRDITERKKVEEEKSRLLRDLHEHLKELNCFYGMSRLFEKSDVSLDDALQKMADLLPPAMQYPDITCARIVVENREFSTKNFKETRWKLQADVEIFGKKVGSVEVRYLEERPTIAECPFLKEERLLIDAVAERLGKITERKRAEKMLQESEERFRAIFEGANDGILLADVKTKRFFFANPRICEITGYSLEELLKLGVGDIHPKKDLPYVIDSFTKLVQGKLTVAKDIPVLRKDGRVVYCDVNARSAKIGSQEYLIGLFRDVTERRKAEEKLRQNSDRIEMMNEKLRVVGGLSRHDVNNKLSAVTGYAYLLKKKYADQADIVEGLGIMEQAVKEVGKIFDFARMYEKLGVEELTYVDVEKTLDEAVALFSGLTIKVVNGCHGLTVLADSFLRQLFYNFIDNTRKYGWKATAVRVYYEKAELDGLRLVYEDDGVGISAESKLKLFTEGFSTGGSTGFGLFLIRKMMDVYGWQIQEIGELEKGAKFVITIPKANLNGKENYQLS